MLFRKILPSNFNGEGSLKEKRILTRRTIPTVCKTQDSHIRRWIAPIALGLVIAIIGGWGFASILTHQSFQLVIDIQLQQITFSAGVQLPFPVIVGEDGKTYIEGVPVRAWLESQGFTVVWDENAKEIIATKE